MLLKFLVITILIIPLITYSDQSEDSLSTINDLTVLDAEGNPVKLSDYNGKVLLIVNVASKCGFTKQYEGLQEIYDQYKDQGLEILAFPCNDFGNQEPGTNKEIKEFCSINFGVSFKLFDKVKVLGADKSQLYTRLTNNTKTGTGDVQWNFEKFVISKNGEIVKRFPSEVEPDDKKLISVIEEELKQKES